MEFNQEQNGVWFRPKRKYWMMKCCDCGLIHKVEFKIDKDNAGRNVILMRAWRSGEYEQ